MLTPTDPEFWKSAAAPEMVAAMQDEPGIVPRFYHEVAPDIAESEAQGLQVFKQVEMVEINRAGDRLNSWAGEVTDEHRQRFPQAYRRFVSGEAPAVTGFPLEQWPLINAALCRQWRAQGLTSVEEVAGLSDGLIGNLGMDGIGWRKKAQAWLAAQKDASTNARLTEMNTKLERENKRLTQQMEDLMRRVEAVESGEPPPPRAKLMPVGRQYKELE